MRLLAQPRYWLHQRTASGHGLRGRVTSRLLQNGLDSCLPSRTLPSELFRENAMNSTAAVFATTHWSVVLAAGQRPDVEASAALEHLCSLYWYPLYAYIRRRGYGVHDAQDSTQGFFAHLLRGERWCKLAPEKGKFRSFLITSLNNFLADEFDRAQAQKRGGGLQIIPFESEDAERRYQLEPLDHDTAERLFERRWALALTDHALARLEGEYREQGRAALFSHLCGTLVERGAVDSHAVAAERLGMTEAAVRKAAQRLRQRYREILRDTVSQTVGSRGEIEEELRYLRSVVGRG